MTECCPTCGAELREEAVIWDSNAGVLVADGKVVRFRRREAKIFDALWRARNRGGFQTQEQFISAAYADDVHGGPVAPNTLSVHLSNMRERLEGSGYSIPTNNGCPRTGYRLVRNAA